MEVRIARRERDHLGEGACWPAGGRELLRVDITAGLVHRWDPAGGEQRTERFDGETGAAVPRTNGGMVVAVDRRLVLLDADGARRTLLEVEPGRDGNRFNDCRADTAGRLWAGTMSKTREPGAAALYRVEPGGECRPVLTGLTLSNGICWSPAGDAMYHVDSTAQRIDRYDFDPALGGLRDRRALAEIAPEDGLPDGLCPDADGGVWVSLFGGGALHRYDERGTLTERVELPVTNPTCPAFGGDDLATLFVTTSRHTLSDKQQRVEPAAGCLLALEPGARGLPSFAFAG
jgi:sugar lactone lactonase YvrE